MSSPQPSPGGVHQGGEQAGGTPPQPSGQPSLPPPDPGLPPPQQPPVGQFPGQPFPPDAAPPPEKKKRGKLAIVGGVLVAVAVAFVVRLAIGAVLGGADNPEVGDCVNDAFNPDDIEVVDCGSADAAWEVIGVHGDMSEADFDAIVASQDTSTVCTAFPEWENAIWFGDQGGDGEVFCVVAAG